MNFQQLRFVREAVRQNMNLTEVAKRAVHVAIGRVQADQGS